MSDEFKDSFDKIKENTDKITDTLDFIIKANPNLKHRQEIKEIKDKLNSIKNIADYLKKTLL